MPLADDFGVLVDENGHVLPCPLSWLGGRSRATGDFVFPAPARACGRLPSPSFRGAAGRPKRARLLGDRKRLASGNHSRRAAGHPARSVPAVTLADLPVIGQLDHRALVVGDEVARMPLRQPLTGTKLAARSLPVRLATDVSPSRQNSRGRFHQRGPRRPGDDVSGLDIGAPAARRRCCRHPCCCRRRPSQ